MYKRKNGWTCCSIGDIRNLSDIAFPPDTSKLTFNNPFFNQSVDILSTLTCLTHLSFEYNFNRPLDNLLRHLPNLTYLYVYGSFNQPLTYLPPNLTHLRLSDNFNQQKIIAPQTLTHLRLCLRHNTIERIINIEDLYNLQVIYTNTMRCADVYPYTYYMLDCNVSETLDRCIINTKNLLIKQTAFYDT